MMKPTMTSQWDAGNYKPLDMSKIPRYPRQLPQRYERWLPRFIGSDGKRVDHHMNHFYSYFGLQPVNDDAEDVVMKFFSTTLHGNARKWYDNFPDASITTMEKFEETFLEKWGIQLKDISILQKEHEDIKQTKNETLWDFRNRFEHALYQIPKDHRPKDKYIVHLYIHALLAHLGFPLSKRAPRTLYEAHDMAIRIQQNISLSEIRYLFTSGTRSRESLFALENFIVDFQEEGEQTIDQHRICLNITPEEHRERTKEAARKARMKIINNLDPESKEKLAKREFHVYRQKKLNQPTLTIPAITQTKPSPSNILPPKIPKTERVDLNFDFEGALSKMHVTIPLREVIKVPSVKERFDNFFKGSDAPVIHQVALW
jgi:hypothetical protein